MAATPPKGLHDLAVEAQNNVHLLATGLAHAGANPQAVAQLSKFAEVLGQIASAVHESPGVEQAAQEGPQAVAAPPGAAPPGAPPGAPPAPQGPPASPHPFHAAAAATHQLMQQAAAQR